MKAAAVSRVTPQLPACQATHTVRAESTQVGARPLVRFTTRTTSSSQNRGPLDRPGVNRKGASSATGTNALHSRSGSSSRASDQAKKTPAAECTEPVTSHARPIKTRISAFVA